ncbi:MAG: homoserine dehydrogenase [Planctomycetota bacterium]|nr:homoserine dehydrogenase [Planctomycetota bacterium]
MKLEGNLIGPRSLSAGEPHDSRSTNMSGTYGSSNRTHEARAARDAARSELEPAGLRHRAGRTVPGRQGRDLNEPADGRGEIVVLKFGSSILTHESSVAVVVSEIYRHVRRGRRVVAVVSALFGRTNKLLDAARKVSGEADGHALASLLATGEHQSAALVAVGLAQAGIPHELVNARQSRLLALGNPLDAAPVSVDAGRLHALLDDGKVVVVPGFEGVDEQDRAVVLGRGGSDLTAVFLAGQLGARAILLKDTGAVLERAPSSAEPRPRAFESLSYDRLLEVSAKVVQPKAVEVARRSNAVISVQAVNRESSTRVGDFVESLREHAGERHRRLRVVILGLGNVGLALYRRLANEPERFNLLGVLVRDATKVRGDDVPGQLLTTRAEDLFAKRPDVVVELIGGVERATQLVEQALEAGADVVTANKAAIATNGARIEAASRRAGRSVRFSAAVGGAAPLLETARLAGTDKPVRALRGVVNGTCNFILNRLASGDEFEVALREAQRRGFAEADPSFDLLGLDAAQKLVLLVREAFGVSLRVDDVQREALTPDIARAVREAADVGLAVRQVSSAVRTPEGVVARVSLAAARNPDPLAQLDDATNRVVFTREDGVQFVASGAGAGGWPTAEAVLADLNDLDRERHEPELGLSISALGAEASAEPASSVERAAAVVGESVVAA